MVDRKMLARVLGMILFIFGFIILLANAIDYLSGFFGLSSDVKLPSSGIGIVYSCAWSLYANAFSIIEERVIGDIEFLSPPL